MHRTPPIVLFCLLSLACGGAEPAADAPAADEVAATEEQTAPTDRVELAMTAAPEPVSAEATIMDFDDAGNLAEIRPGTNGWLCLPDSDPAAPGDAPICVDGAWQQWFDAYMNRSDPTISGLGISYMLPGGPAASNTDPFATAPPAGQDWIQDGPHVMVIVPDASLLDAFPTDHASGGPYVMWKGTPYAHLMVPVAR